MAQLGISTSCPCHKHTTAPCRARHALPRRRRSIQTKAEKEAGPQLNLLEAPVPAEQRPCNELQALKKDGMYSWAALPPQQFGSKLLTIFVISGLIGGPIATQTFDPLKQPLEWVLSVGTGGMLLVALTVIRLYTGWAYVGERLLSASIPYEETGWYDGQVFVKPPEVLTRDRLLGAYEVKPALQRLRGTLVGTGAALLVVALTLAGLLRVDEVNEVGPTGRGAVRLPTQVTSNGVVYSKKVKALSQLVDDDELAAEEAAAQKGIPGYCSDRLLRAFAGGGFCSKFD